jgi:hypothetical protein
MAMIKPHHQACAMMLFFMGLGLYLTYSGSPEWGWVCMLVVVVFAWIAVLVYQEPIKQRGLRK